MAWKCTLYFTQDKYGWSECFYNLSQTARDVRIQLYSLATARARILGDGAVLTQATLSHTRIWKCSAAIGVPQGGFLDQADSPFVCALLHVWHRQSGTGHAYRRDWMVRGLPARLVRRLAEGRDISETIGAARLQAFFSVLTGGNWMLQVASKDNPWLPVQSVDVLSLDGGNVFGQPFPEDFDQGGNFQTVVALQGNARVPETDPETGKPTNVFLRGVKWSDPKAAKCVKLNGTHTVDGSLPGVVCLSDTAGIAGQYAGSGWLQVRQTSYVPITGVDIAAVREKKCGKPLYSAILADGSGFVAADSLGDSGEVSVSTSVVTEEEPPEWNIQPVTRTIGDARQLVSLCYDGYASGDPAATPIQIAPLANVPDTWVVCASGTTRVFDPVTGLVSDIASALSIPGVYRNRIRQVIEENIPRGGKVWLVGHSLGAMELQHVAISPTGTRNPVQGLILFAAPVTCFDFVHSRRFFAMPGDPVVSASPFGLILALALQNQAEQTYLDPGDVPLTVPNRHNDFDHLPALDDWNPDGTMKSPGNQVTWEIGPVSKFPGTFTGN